MPNAFVTHQNLSRKLMLPIQAPNLNVFIQIELQIIEKFLFSTAKKTILNS